MTERTQKLADWIIDFNPARLDAAQREALRLLMVDSLACSASGAYLPWGRNLAEWARDYEASGPCPIIGADFAASAPIAALLNATAAHGLEMDDTHDASLSHPGAAVVATALAVGVETNASEEAIFGALAAGYEATARVGMAAGAAVLEYGFHPTALFGGFGAAAAAARLYGCTAQELVDAWGTLLSMVGGSGQFSQDARGTVVKRLHGGFGAKNGIMAVQWARHGIAGPAGAVDGRYGLIRLFSQGDADETKLDMDDKRPLAFTVLSLKPYPCCRLFHSTIDAAREIVGELPMEDISQIERIDVGGPNVFPDQHMIRRPTSMMAAQYSLPWCMAVALDAGPFDASGYKEDNLSHPARQVLADKVYGYADAEMQAAFPDHFGSWIEMSFADGTKRKVTRLDSYGTVSHPMSRDDIVSKADGLLSQLPLTLIGSELAEHISRIGEPGGLSRLMASLQE